jgi:hypothetical protein
MATYLISYDLDKPGQDYTDLINAIKQGGGRRGLYSEWFIATNSSARQIYDGLSPFIDRNDRLIVLKVSGEATWSNLMIPDEAVRKFLTA